MNLSEVKREYEQGNGGFQVVPFAAKTVRQSRQSAHTHSNGQVRSFNVTRANHIAVRIAEPRLNDCALEFGRRVARRPLRHSSVNLYQLAIVNPRSETQTNSVRIGVHAVRGQLELSRRGLVQLFNKDFCIGAGTSAKVPRENDFAVALNGEERPSITLALVIRVALIPFFAVAKSPQLVSLYVLHGYFADLLLQHALALVPSDFEHSQHARDCHVAQSRGAANAATLSQAIENAKEFFVRQIDCVTRLHRARRECPATLATPKAWRFIFSVIAVRLRRIDVTSWTMHGLPLSFLTRYTVGTSIQFDGLGSHLRCESGYGLIRRYKHWINPVNGLAATVGFKPTKPASGLAGLQPAPIDHSGTSPSIQRSSILLISRIQFNSWRRRFNLQFSGFRRNDLAFPSVHGFPVRASNSYCLAAFHQSFKYSVNARQRVGVAREIVILQQEHVSHRDWRPILICRLKHLAASISELEVVNFVYKRSNNFPAKVTFPGKLRQTSNSLLQLKDSFFSAFPFNVKLGLLGVDLVSFLEKLIVFVAGGSKSLFPVHNEEL